MKTGSASPGPAQPFFGSRGFLQRKCASCVAEPFFGSAAGRIQRQAADEVALEPAELEPAGPEPEAEAEAEAEQAFEAEPAPEQEPGPEPEAAEPVAEKPEAVEEEPEAALQPRLEVGAVDDPLELEADAMADRVVRRRAGGRAARGSGPAEGGRRRRRRVAGRRRRHRVDLSPVRVHTGSASAGMNDRIGVRAFTHGTDIHFNTGEYRPGTAEGTRLLAHEMTHVVQQNSGLRRKPRALAGAIRRAAAGAVIRRKPTAFGPVSGFPRGALIHKETLPQFLLPRIAPMRKSNKNLVIEPGTPGANKDGDHDIFAHGKPEFYRAEKVIGLRVTPTGFGGLNTRAAAAHQPGRAGPAPRQPAGADRARRPEAGLLRRGVSRRVADLKLCGRHQEDRRCRQRPPDDPRPCQALEPRALRRRLAGNTGPAAESCLPARLRRVPACGLSLRLSRGDKAARHADDKSDVAGIYAYEWVLESVPEDLGNDEVVTLVERLDRDVVPQLQAQTRTAPKLKNTTRPVRRALPRKTAPRRVLQRAPKPHKKFDARPFNEKYRPWREDAGKALGPKGKPKDAVFEALEGAKRRSKVNLTIPAKVRMRARAFKKARHWHKYGRLYVWFRKTFDRIYVKLANFGAWIKRKLAGLRKVGSTSFGNWIKAAARTLFKAFKTYSSWAVEQVADKLLDSLQEGVSNSLRRLVDSVTPEDVKSKIEEVHALRDKFEKLLAETTQAIEQKLFGDKLEMLSKIDKFMEIASTVSTIVSIIKWGIRIAACASPPLLGCLWNLAITALEYAFTKIMETCWFEKKVYGWIRDNGTSSIVRPLFDFPTDVAAAIVDRANKAIPLPEGIGPVFEPIRIRKVDFKIDCGGGGGGGEPTPEQKALIELAERVGDAKFEALIDMLAKRAAGHGVALTPDRITALGPLIDSLTVEKMKLIAEGQKTDVPAPVEEFLKQIATFTPQEQERIEKRDIDYDKAQRSNPQFQGSLKWKPETFVREGIAPDSKEFADAIYDIQEMLGIKPDGMAGRNTVKTYYEKNSLPKDRAYKNAVAEVEAERLKREEIGRIKKILAEPYPTEDQLRKDLAAASFPSIEEGARLDTAGGRNLILVTSSKGSRLGAYYKEVEIERKGRRSRSCSRPRASSPSTRSRRGIRSRRTPSAPASSSCRSACSCLTATFRRTRSSK